MDDDVNVLQGLGQASEQEHRIHNPISCIRYNPSLSHHTQAILELIAK